MSSNQHRSRPLVWTLSLPLILALISLSCGLTGRLANLRAEPEFRPTRTPMPTFTPTAANAAFIEVPVINRENVADPQAQASAGGAAAELAESSPAPAPAEEPTPVPEPTEEPPASNTSITVTIINNMNVRGGPGTNYPVIGSGPAGASSTLVGRNADSSWLQVQYPPSSDNTGWVYAKLVQVSADVGTVDVVQVAPPPQPVAAAPAPKQEEAPAPPPPPKFQFTPTGWHASENAAIVHFKGRIKDEGGNLVNGYSIRITNWSWSIISHPTGASPWYPDKGDGEWDITGIPLFDAQGWWYLSVVRYDCDFWAGFDAQCKSYTMLSEEIPVEVKTPEESIINADWICHWDCDKGVYVQAYRK